VGDAALLLGAIGRFDLRDPYCLPDDARDWRDGLEAGVAGLRVAVLRGPGFEAPVDWEGIAAVEEAAGVLIAAGAEVEQVEPELPDTRAVFSRIWGAALARLVAGVPETRRQMLDPGLLTVAAAMAGATAADMLEAEAQRLLVAHAMARLHQKFDLVLCPTVPNGPLPADEKVVDPLGDLWGRWAPWTLLFNLSRQPAITVPIGFGGGGLPRSVQLAAALYRDDLVLRAARTIELARPGATPELVV
jgi:aspartyl-tRNA(Asn)/glutamyl-tRNA(Gln) amidotransferase subunit A